MRSKGDGAKAATQALQSYDLQIAELEAERAAAQAAQDAAAAEYGEALREASIQFLPDASEAAMASAEGWTGAPLRQRRTEYASQREQRIQRLHQIARDPRFQQRDTLLDPHRGTLATQRAQWQTYAGQLQAHLAKFNNETFHWIRNRELEQRATGATAFGSFWRAVTFAGTREERARIQCASELGYPSYDELIKDFEGTEAKLHEAGQRIQAIDEQRKATLALLEEHAELYEWVHNFEGHVVTALRTDVGRALSAADLPTMRRRLGSAAVARTLSRAHGLSKKRDYLAGVAAFAVREIQDRHKRKSSIAAVRGKWMAKPWDPLSGDKSKWLVALPHMKRESTKKRSRWLKRMHHGVSMFDDWDEYDRYMREMDDFCPYDAFAHRADEPLPYDGFAREVIHDVAHYRELHGQAKADYSEFKKIDKSGPDDEPMGGDDGDWGDDGDSGDDDHDHGDDDGFADGGAEAAAALAMAEATGAFEGS